MSRAYVLIFDGYADWEIGYVLAELRRFGKVEVVTVGLSKKVVVSMGGLHVVPDMSVSEMKMDDVLIFIIPGGNMWGLKSNGTETYANGLTVYNIKKFVDIEIALKFLVH